MKVRVCYTVDVPDNYRKAMRLRLGYSGLATRKEIVDHFILYGSSIDDDLMHEYTNEMEQLDECAPI